ncbi:MAG: carbohydrate ABC transporter permease [Sphaerochaetaceae bacterium]|nr:carbohydrate ABC transporter permease [Sphaerochaetaceae bacterium]MDC7248961.1 carbohydrate ABC transporter permease [Sphaerochaetaceae bacterium]
MNDTLKKTIFNLIILIISIIAVVPFIWSLLASINPNMVMDREFFSPFNFTFSNYKYILMEFPYSRWFLNSVIVSVFVCLGNLIINTMAGYSLARLNFKGSKFILWLTISLMMIPSQVLLAPTYIVLTKLNWIATYKGLIIPFLFNLFNIFLVYQFLLDIPKDLEEAGEIDGLNPIGIFLNIIIPLSVPILITQSILSFTNNWNSYLWPSLIGNVENYYTLPVGLNSFYGVYYQDGNSVQAGVMLLTLPVIIFYIIAQKFLKSNDITTGIKA